MAAANSALLDSMEIGIEIELNPEIETGHSLALTRVLSAEDKSALLVENTFVTCRLDQPEKQHHSAQHHQVHHELQQQKIEDATRGSLDFPNQLSSSGQNQQHQLFCADGMVTGGPEANKDGAALVLRNVSNESLREPGYPHTELNPRADEFVSISQSHTDMGRKKWKLNPFIQEFFPRSLSTSEASSSNRSMGRKKWKLNLFAPRSLSDIGSPSNRSGSGANGYKSRAQCEDNIRRTIYVGQIGQQVTEEQLVALFVTVGQVVDCRIWGDPKSRLRFGFVEFTEEDGARSALRLSGIMLDCYNSIHVWPSKTGIVPINPTFLPHSDDERRRCARTIYCKNIDKVLTQTQVKLFFEGLCGKVAQLRLLGNSYHSTQMAFVEFAMPESATAALNWNGAIFGSLPIRVSPSKTPVRFA